MIRVNLPHTQSWKGQIYPAGDREIPEDLAIALGITPAASPAEATPQTATVAETPAEPPAPEPEAIAPAEEPTEPEPKTTRAKK